VQEDMRVINWVRILIIGVFLVGCSNQEKTDANEAEIIENEGEAGFSEFVANFNEIKLPYYLPVAKAGKGAREIDKSLIKKFLENKTFTPAFGPENLSQTITDNFDSSIYYYDAKLSKTQGYTGIIILKESKLNRSQYYYLCNFTPDGNFIDGMCIAFDEAKKSAADAERSATINEDMSIHIRQQPVAEGERSGSAQSRFYELTPEGKIAGIQLGI
jgi:hypothetical protein